MADELAMIPLDPEVRRQNWLLLDLMPDATHVCCRCWLPIFSADEHATKCHNGAGQPYAK